MQHLIPTADTREAIQTEADPLPALLNRLSITTWDLLIVGDGSGTTWEKACGWSSVLIDRQTRQRRMFYGATNAGSVNFAESMPYVQALNWFDQHFGKDRLETLGSMEVWIITDSQVIANWGAAAMSPDSRTPRKQGAYWAAMRYLKSIGYNCHFRWFPRMSTQLNAAADLVAGLSRVAMTHVDADTTNTGRRQAEAAIAQLDFRMPDQSPLDIYTLH